MYTSTFLILLSIKALISFGCRVVPSEYAFLTLSVHRKEESSANCRTYSEISNQGDNVRTALYTHCDGTPLRLTDSDFGSEQYMSNDYYVWPAGSSASQLLFIFPTRVNLTTITLHYYSDNFRGLPRLRFYAVPDDFDVWDASATSYSHVDVPAAAPPDGRPAESKSITTERVLQMSNPVTIATVPFSGDDYTVHKTTESTSEIFTMPTSKNSSATTTTAILKLSTMPASESINSQAITTVIIGVATAILLLLLLTIVSISLFILWRKFARHTVEYESSYSTLCRGVQQVKSQSVHTFNELYDQIQLSPSTGQAEFISRNETANTNNPPPHQTEYDIHPSVDKDKPKSDKLKITASTISSQKENKNTPEQPTYAVVNKKKKSNESGYRQSQNIAAQTQNVMEKSAVKHGHQVKQSQDDIEADTKLVPEMVESLQDLYSVVKKKPKQRPVEDDKPPPIPPYKVEELYAAVKKVSKTKTGDNEDAAPKIPPHSIDEMYTAVQKKPKASNAKDEEEAPPIPAHTVEELFTAVMKKPKVTIAEDEEEIPPVPPHIMEEL